MFLSSMESLTLSALTFRWTNSSSGGWNESQLGGSKQTNKQAEILYHFVHLPTKQFFLSTLAK